MANTAYTETAAIRLDGSLADSTIIRFADEGANSIPGGKESVVTTGICSLLTVTCLVVIFIVDA